MNLVGRAVHRRPPRPLTAPSGRRPRRRPRCGSRGSARTAPAARRREEAELERLVGRRRARPARPRPPRSTGSRRARGARRAYSITCTRGIGVDADQPPDLDLARRSPRTPRARPPRRTDSPARRSRRAGPSAVVAAPHEQDLVRLTARATPPPTPRPARPSGRRRNTMVRHMRTEWFREVYRGRYRAVKQRPMRVPRTSRCARVRATEAARVSSRPIVSGKPHMQFAHCTVCPLAPLHEVVERGEQIQRAVALVGERRRRRRSWCRARPRALGASPVGQHAHEGLARVGLVQRRARAPASAAARPQVDARGDAARSSAAGAART